MPFPSVNHNPPFSITRASHVVLTVKDLSKSLVFYEQVIGLIITERVNGMAYLRGLEEDCHHSLTLKEDGAGVECEQLGFRVRDDADLDQAAIFFESLGMRPRWVDVPYQRKTLRVRDPQGIPIELCSSMPTQPRFTSKPQHHKGGCALRFDHTQVNVPDVLKSYDFYVSLGFMTSDYAYTPAGELVAAFLRRKNNPHDIVLASRAGPRLHHFAYIVDAHNLMRAGDTAASLGFGKQVEYGPSRHGQDHASFVYFRDPDGHRIELLSHPVQIIDLDSKPVGRDVTDRAQFVAWGPATPGTFLSDASLFPGEPVLDAVVKRSW